VACRLDESKGLKYVDALLLDGPFLPPTEEIAHGERRGSWEHFRIRHAIRRIKQAKEDRVMIVEYTRYHVDCDQASALERAYERAQSVLMTSPHCMSYELSHGVEDPGSYTLRIEWDSLDGLCWLLSSYAQYWEGRYPICLDTCLPMRWSSA
jgi:hypothetical protein